MRVFTRNFAMVLTGLLMVTGFASGDIINLVDFETASGYVKSIESDTYFMREDGSNVDYNLQNIQGYWYFWANDIDREGLSPLYLYVENVDISGYSSLSFSIYLAEDDEFSGSDYWDADDYVHILYDINNSGTYKNLIWIENNGGSNTAPQIDTDFDGNGDGAVINNIFTEFTASIPDTGSVIDIKIEYSGLQSRSENIEIDNIAIMGTLGGSEPPLPISLTSFIAAPENGMIELTWTTASETSNARFVIYRNDEMIGSVEGAGTTSEPQSYEYKDDQIISGNTYTYVLADISYANEETKYTDKAITVTIPENDIPQRFALGNNYPNPFNPTTAISYQLPADSDVELSIFDMNGRKVATLVKDHVSAGYYTINWDALNVTSGIYLYQLTAGDFVDTKKMVVMR